MSHSSLYLAAELYDAQYDGYRDDLPHYLRLAHDVGDPILELGCGTGRVAAALGHAGYRVTGLDNADRMLERGRARLGAEGVTELVELLNADMRRFDLGRRFPLIIAAFNTLMHLHSLRDQDETLRAVRGHLAAGGAFAFDLYTPLFGPMGVLRREAEWAAVGGERSELFLVQEHDEASQTITSHYHLDTVGPGGELRRSSASLRQRYYNRFEIERALQQAGFGNLTLYGGFDRRPYGSRATHMVGVAKV